MDLQYGKITEHKSFHNGELRSTKMEYSIPTVVHDKTDVLNELMKCIELITDKKTYKLTITIDADAKTHELKLLTKSYIVNRNDMI